MMLYPVLLLKVCASPLLDGAASVVLPRERLPQPLLIGASHLLLCRPFNFQGSARRNGAIAVLKRSHMLHGRR